LLALGSKFGLFWITVADLESPPLSPLTMNALQSTLEDKSPRPASVVAIQPFMGRPHDHIFRRRYLKTPGNLECGKKEKERDQ